MTLLMIPVNNCCFALLYYSYALMFYIVDQRALSHIHTKLTGLHLQHTGTAKAKGLMSGDDSVHATFF